MMRYTAWVATAGIMGCLLPAWTMAHPGLEGKAGPTFRWTALSAQPIAAARRITIADLPALCFDSSKRQELDLTERFPWNRFPGPSTLRIVFQLLHPPGGKVPLVSQWHMKKGGRSWELGVTPDGRPYLDLSASGNWDGEACELLGTCQLVPGKPYCIAAVFVPGRHMKLSVNGHACGITTSHVPKKVFESTTPIWLAAQPPGVRFCDVAISELTIEPRVLTVGEIRAWAQSLKLTTLPKPPDQLPSPTHDGIMDLAEVRRQVLAYCRALQVNPHAVGIVRQRPLARSPTTLYASCDVAWIRACMGERLTKTLTTAQRRRWIDHINSFARKDGTYENPNHGVHHRNGMVIGALAVLGGRQKYPVRLYDEFDSPEEIGPWLERIQWDRQWGASHLIWGGMLYYSFSRQCSDAWRQRVFEWLDRNVDPRTGWWRKGVRQAGRPIEVLGGAAHIWPLYQLHDHRFPCPKNVIDSILSMQQPDGSWLEVCNYMELDALYGLGYMHQLVPDYRAGDIARAARMHGRLLQQHYVSYMSSYPDSHGVLAVVSTLALLQRLDGTHFRDSVAWSDIFSDPKFTATDRVEYLPH